MSLYQTLYFMSLVGGIAGLLSWALTALLSAVIVNHGSAAISDLLSAMILGGFIGGFTVAFSDKWSGSRVIARWVVSGTVIGIGAGLAAGLLQIPITDNLAAVAPTLSRVITWMMAGS